MAAAMRRARDSLPLVNLGRVLVTGNNPFAHDRRLGAEIDRGTHGFVLDVGCGDARLLNFANPDRYVGLDIHRPSLERARRRWDGSGMEFVEMDITRSDLTPWRGADVAVMSNFLHHLSDTEALNLLQHVVRDAQPGRILVQDAQPSGVMGPVVRALDDGEHLRSRTELIGLLQPTFAVREVAHWSNRLKSFAYFLLELRAPSEAGR